MSTSLQIIYFVVVAINTLIVAPIILYYTRKLWILRDAKLLSKRYPKLVVLCVCSVVLYSVICLPIAWIPEIVPSINYGSTALTGYISWIFRCSWYICLNIYIYRIFLLYCDYKRGLYLISKQWQSQITQINNEQDTHWTIKYNKWLAPKSPVVHCIIISVVWFLFFQTIALLTILIDKNHAFELYGLTTCILYVIIVFIAGLKIRSCRDECFVLAEIKFIGALGVLFIITWIIIVFIIGKMLKKYQLMVVLWNINFKMILIFPAGLIVTKWSINQCEKRILYSSKPLNTKIKLGDILKNKDGFDLFTEHLVKEYSTENLLFLYEAIHFKSQCFKNRLIDKEEFKLQLDFGERVNQTQRQNSIVHDMESFYYNFKYLINRYIADHAENCVNISSSTRQQIMSMSSELPMYGQPNLSPSNQPTLSTYSSLAVASVELKQHFQQHSGIVIRENWNSRMQVDDEYQIRIKSIGLLDEAIKEIIRLISTDSFARFMQTDKFKQIVRTIHIK